MRKYLASSAPLECVNRKIRIASEMAAAAASEMALVETNFWVNVNAFVDGQAAI